MYIENMTKTAVAVPRDLLEQFDHIIEKDYSSRSHAIRDALIHYIQYYEWMHEIDGERAGTITIVYDPGKKGLIESIFRLKDNFRNVIRSIVSLYINNNRNIRLELMMVMGDGKLLVALAEQIQSLNGVSHVKLTTIKKEKETKKKIV